MVNSHRHALIDGSASNRGNGPEGDGLGMLTMRSARQNVQAEIASGPLFQIAVITPFPNRR